MNRSLATLVMTSLFATSAFAGLVTTTKASGKSVEGVSVAQEANVNLNNQAIPVSVIGAGLRTKKVLIAKVKVYVAELLSSDASKFVRADGKALASLEESRTIALRMTFLRDVEAEKVQTSFKEALATNQVNTNDAAVSQFLAAVSNGGEAKSGKSLVIVTQKNADGSESVSYEDTNGKVTTVAGTKGLSAKIMSIWLGKPSDDGVANLKAQIIQGL